MVRSEIWLGNVGISCHCLGKSLAEAVRNCAIKDNPEIFMPEKKSFELSPECNKRTTHI